MSNFSCSCLELENTMDVLRVAHDPKAELQSLPHAVVVVVVVFIISSVILTVKRIL